MNGCVWAVFAVCAVVGAIALIAGIFDAALFGAALVRIIGASGLLALSLVILRVLLVSFFRRGRRRG
jgi:hypothetical protein